MLLEEVLKKVQDSILQGKIEPTQLLCALLHTYSEEIFEQPSSALLSASLYQSSSSAAEPRHIDQPIRGIIQELIQVDKSSAVREEKASGKEEEKEEASAKEEHEKHAAQRNEVRKKLTKILEKVEPRDPIFLKIQPLVQAVFICFPVFKKEVLRNMKEEIASVLQGRSENAETLIASRTVAIQTVWRELLASASMSEEELLSQGLESVVRASTATTEEEPSVNQNAFLLGRFLKLGHETPDHIPEIFKPAILRFIVLSSVLSSVDTEFSGILSHNKLNEFYPLFELLVAQKEEYFSEARSLLIGCLKGLPSSLNCRSPLWSWFFNEALKKKPLSDADDFKDLSSAYYRVSLSLDQAALSAQAPKEQVALFIEELENEAFKCYRDEREIKVFQISRLLSQHEMLQAYLDNVKKNIETTLPSIKNNPIHSEVKLKLFLLKKIYLFISLAPQEELSEFPDVLMMLFEVKLYEITYDPYFLAPFLKKSTSQSIQRLTQKLIESFPLRKNIRGINLWGRLSALCELWVTDAPLCKEGAAAFSLQLAQLIRYDRDYAQRLFSTTIRDKKVFRLLSRWFSCDPRRLVLFTRSQGTKADLSLGLSSSSVKSTESEANDFIGQFLAEKMTDQGFFLRLLRVLINNKLFENDQGFLAYMLIAHLRERLSIEKFDFTNRGNCAHLRSTISALLKFKAFENKKLSELLLDEETPFLSKEVFNVLYNELKKGEFFASALLAKILEVFHFEIQECITYIEEIESLPEPMQDSGFDVILILQEFFNRIPPHKRPLELFNRLRSDIVRTLGPISPCLSKDPLSLAEWQSYWDHEKNNIVSFESYLQRVSLMLEKTPSEKILSFYAYILKNLPEKRKDEASWVLPIDLLQALYQKVSDKQKPLILHGLLAPHCLSHCASYPELYELTVMLLAQERSLEKREQEMAVQLCTSDNEPLAEDVVSLVKLYAR